MKMSHFKCSRDSSCLGLDTRKLQYTKVQVVICGNRLGPDNFVDHTFIQQDNLARQKVNIPYIFLDLKTACHTVWRDGLRDAS